jgi:hypothetical protein
MTDISEIYNCQYIRVVCPHKMLKHNDTTNDLKKITRFIYPDLNYTNPLLRLLVLYGSHDLPLYIFKSTLPMDKGIILSSGRNSPTNGRQSNRINVINLVYTDPFYEHNDIKTISRSYINLILQWNNRLILNFCTRMRIRLQDIKYTTLLYVDKIIDKYEDHPNGCDFCKYECCINGIYSPNTKQNAKLHDSYDDIGYLPDFHEKIMIYDPEVLDPRFKNIQFGNRYLYTYTFKYDDSYQLVKMDRSLKEYKY